MNRLLSIGEFARLTGLSVSAVRFYADRGLLRPARVDPSSGYRSFEPGQVEAGCLVRDLRLIGVPLARVEPALGLPRHQVQLMVDVHIASLEGELQAAQEIGRSLGSASRTDSTRHQATVLAAADLVTALTQLLPFASTDRERPHLMTILIEAKDGSVRMATTDTHRLAVRDLVAIEHGEDFAALIPAATAQRWLTELRPNQDVRLCLDGASLTASDGEVVSEAQVVPAAFPDYEAFLTPRAPSSAVIVDRQALLDGLRRFDGKTGAVLLSTAPDQLRICRREVEVEMKGEHDGIEVHVALDPTYVVEAAESAIGSELVVEIERDSLRPLLFRSATNGTFVSLLMPVKLD